MHGLIPALNSPTITKNDNPSDENNVHLKTTIDPQIADLMKEEDYTKTLLLFFGEDFGAEVKARMEEAAALKKTLAQSSKGKKTRQLCLWHWHVLPGPQIWPAWTSVTNPLQMGTLCFFPDICPNRTGLQSLFRTSFTQDFWKMKSCVLYKLCWLMRNVLQLLGHLRGRILFFSFMDWKT